MNTVRNFGAAACLLFSVSSHADLRIHDNSAVFLEYWNRYEGLSVEEKVEGFKREVVPSFPEFYNYRFERWERSGKSIDTELADQLRLFPQLRERFEAVSQDLAEVVHNNMEIFLTTFPDFQPDIDVYFIHSLGEMDGGTRKLNGRTHLIFGVDGIARYHAPGNNQSPFIHHELFHVYHWPIIGNWAGLYNALWEEGLAVYVAQVLNSNATLDELSLNYPPDLISNCERIMPELTADFLMKVDELNEENYTAYFMSGSRHPWIPSRSGYYIGYRVAGLLAEKYSLHELVHLRGDILRREIISALKTLGGHE